MAKFPTVRETHEIIQKNPQDLKVIGRAMLLCLAGQEQEIVGLRKALKNLADFTIALSQGDGAEEMPAEPGSVGQAASAEDEGSLRPNVAGGGAVNPQPIVQAASPMPPQKNGSQVAPPIVGPVVTPNAQAAKQ